MLIVDGFRASDTARLLEAWRDAARADVRLCLRRGGRPTCETRDHERGTHPELRERTPDDLEDAALDAYYEAYDAEAAAHA